MKFDTTRLCGGLAIMASPLEECSLNMTSARNVLAAMGTIKESDELMIVLLWNEMEVTVYPQGKIMFHPLADKAVAVRYANEILNKIK